MLVRQQTRKVPWTSGKKKKKTKELDRLFSGVSMKTKQNKTKNSPLRICIDKPVLHCLPGLGYKFVVDGDPGKSQSENLILKWPLFDSTFEYLAVAKECLSQTERHTYTHTTPFFKSHMHLIF